jgi:voltage-gated potassium channel Kch
MTDTFNLVIQFIKLLVLVLLIAHWGACFWFLVGFSEWQNNGISWITEAQIQDAGTYVQYVNSLYFFITTMTTVGYGDIVAITANEKLYVIFSMLLACGVFAYVIGSIGTVISSRYDSENAFKQKIMYTNQFLVHKNIDKPLRLKVRRYLEHVLVKINI